MRICTIYLINEINLLLDKIKLIYFDFLKQWIKLFVCMILSKKHNDKLTIHLYVSIVNYRLTCTSASQLISIWKVVLQTQLTNSWILFSMTCMSVTSSSSLHVLGIMPVTVPTFSLVYLNFFFLWLCIFWLLLESCIVAFFLNALANCFY